MLITVLVVHDAAHIARDDELRIPLRGGKIVVLVVIRLQQKPRRAPTQAEGKRRDQENHHQTEDTPPDTHDDVPWINLALQPLAGIVQGLQPAWPPP